MNIIALFKIVPDDTLIKISGNSLDLNVPNKISTYDKNAIEEAVRIKEKHGGKAYGITAGITDRKTIREALAMGLDEVISIDMKEMDVMTTAEAIAEEVNQIKPDIILAGESTTDSSGSVLPSYLAAMLNYPIVSYAKSISIEGDKVKIERNLTTLTEIVEAPMPAVISVVGEINTPRIPTVRQILESAKKPVRSLTFNKAPKVKIVSVSPYVIQRKKIIIEGKMEEAVDKLLSYLRGEGVL
ncbi:electron transfer flavoprotein subunit beta/FixA family protein [Acidianus hospitalis]|uniref:Electron transfer flavoprotein beta subunit n=1 Tax=Acidianus hospitalis (strain W1) TaxID=933801 RepID=F4B5N0_ACIHW|nr:electron transfer flavoprotein subunit beta/FixA family protein [Acidianus hospitalis]AEE94454.1 electron transfer flavoprotein beta subunit [Acidianus hospitalis W1]